MLPIFLRPNGESTLVWRLVQGRPRTAVQYGTSNFYMTFLLVKFSSRLSPHSYISSCSSFMASAMQILEWATPCPSSCNLDHQECHSFTNHRHVSMQFSVHGDDEFARHTTSTAIHLKEQPTEKLEWESEDISTHCGKDLFEDYHINAYVSLLQECTDMKAVKEIHAHVLRSGLDQNIILGTKLVHTYTLCGSMENARLAFDKICDRNVFLWNAIIRGYARNGPCDEALALYYKMKQADMLPDKFTFPPLLKACAGLSALQQGKQIHDHIVAAGFESDVFVGAALTDMYAKCGSINSARQVFDKMSTRDVVSWSAMITGYVQNGRADEALALFHQMRTADVTPDAGTMVSVLPACALLGALEQGKRIHGYIVRSGLEFHIFVGTALIDMYAKCGSMEIARQLFDKMTKRNLVSWNAMIAGYEQNGHANEALALFDEMQLTDVKANSVTMVIVLSACAQLGALERGKWIHDYITRSGFQSDVSVGNSLVAMYANCGRIEAARDLFDKMSQRDVVSWNAMIAGYAQNGHANEALTLFYQMQQADLKPNTITMVSVLTACADLGHPQQGMSIHGLITRSGFGLDVSVQTALVAMYARCGSVDVARQAFDKMSKRDVVSWNAMIAAYAQNGHANKALTLFHHMQLAGVAPNSVTVVSVLPACASLGALQEGKWIHDYIVRSGFELDAFVGTALMDMYAKCGSIEIARQLFDNMSERNVISWSAMIAGYGMNGHGKEALALFSHMQLTGSKPTDITFISVLSACSHAGLVDEGWKYFACMSRDYCIMPKVEHYACMVDLLGRAGHLDDALDFIKKMPIEPSAGVWGALLGACRIHCNIELGERVAECLFDLEPGNPGYYVLLSNIYAAAGRWDDVIKVRTMMKNRGLKKTPGCSWIEVSNRVHSFLVGDRSHPMSEKIYATLETLFVQMKESGYVPNMNFVLHDVEEEVKEDMLSSHSEKLAIAFGIISTSPSTPLLITKNLRVCTDCHNATKFISRIVRRKIIVRDSNRFHHFKDGLCSCGDYW